MAGLYDLSADCSTYEKSIRSIEGDEVAEQVADRHNQLKELVETEHLGEQLAKNEIWS